MKSSYLSNSQTIFWCLAILAIYYAIAPIYGIHAVDNAWTLSFDYYYFYQEYEFDKVFKNGQGIVAFFGKIHAWFYGSLLNIIGWTKPNAQIISSILILIAGLFWRKVALKLGYKQESANLILVLMLLLDPFVSSATKARPEALVFTFSSLSILLAVSNRWFLSGILAAAALEIHPMGAVSVCYSAAIIISRYPFSEWEHLSLKNNTFIISLASGFMLGLVVYVMLHYEQLPHLFKHLQGAKNIEKPWWQNFQPYEYFFNVRYYRHVPDFLVLVTAFCTLIYILKIKKNANNRHYFPLLLIIILLIFFIIAQRANQQYGIYLYPAILFCCISVIELLHEKWHLKSMHRVVLALFLLLMLPQYAFIYYKFSGFNMQDYLKKVDSVIPDNNIPVAGHANHWFIFIDKQKNKSKERNFRVNLDEYHQNNTVYYFIRDLWFERYQPLPTQIQTQILNNKISPIATAEYKTSQQVHSIQIYKIIP